MTGWSMVPLGELLNKSEEWVRLDPLAKITQVRVQWWGQGAVVRKTATAGELGSDKWLAVRWNQFLISRIDARKGAAGVVPRSLDGAFVSNDFPAFNINLDRLEPQFLDWYSKTARFVEDCNAASEGTTNRVRLKEDRFFAISMPLPPLDEQRRIIGRLADSVETITATQKLRAHSDSERQSLLMRCHDLAWSKAIECEHHFKTLEEVAQVIDPQPDHRTPPEVMDGLPYVSIANISLEGDVDLLSARRVSSDVVTMQERSFQVQTGDIVIGKIGTIGAARPIFVSSRFALSANVVLVQPCRDTTNPEFLLALLRSEGAKTQFAAGTRRTAQEAFGIKKMRKLTIPIPSLDRQAQIADCVRGLERQLETLRKLQATASEELTALSKSIINAAFSGQL